MKIAPTSLLYLCLLPALSAQYAISGQLNLGEEWQPKVYLAAIDKLSDYYRTSPDMIVATAPVLADGTFQLTGANLPDDARFYRLYLMKQQNTDYDACLYVGGDDHNFAHLILRNGDELHLETDPASVAPFGNYEVVGSNENELMRELAGIVYPSFYFYRIKFPTELKFSEDRLHADLKVFADTVSSPLVALAAVNNTDFDEHFDQDRTFYQEFGERLKQDLPASIYTKNYQLKCRYYANEGSDDLPGWAALALVLLGLLAVTGWWQFVRLQSSVRLREEMESRDYQSSKVGSDYNADGSATFRVNNGHNSTAPGDPLTELTPKEREIFELIAVGRSNKEIAGQLFVEVSTVKTHINKLYTKLGVSNRKSAQSLAKKHGIGED